MDPFLIGSILLAWCGIGTGFSIKDYTERIERNKLLLIGKGTIENPPVWKLLVLYSTLTGPGGVLLLIIGGLFLGLFKFMVSILKIEKESI